MSTKSQKSWKQASEEGTIRQFVSMLVNWKCCKCNQAACMRGSPIIGVLNLCSTLTSIHVGTTLQVCFLPFHRYLSAISLIAHFADINSAQVVKFMLFIVFLMSEFSNCNFTLSCIRRNSTGENMWYIESMICACMHVRPSSTVCATLISLIPDVSYCSVVSHTINSVGYN